MNSFGICQAFSCFTPNFQVGSDKKADISRMDEVKVIVGRKSFHILK